MPEWVECELAQILLVTDNVASPQVIVLREKEGGRSFMVHIGLFEALAINRQVHGEMMPRPMTHDLMVSIIETLDARVVKVAVSDLLEDEQGNGTFYGFMVISRDSGEMVVDCRPSDAVAIAVRVGCPIFVSKDVLTKVSTQ